MSTPLERLTALVNCYTPSKVKFKLSVGSGRSSLLFESITLKQAESIPPADDVKLYELLNTNLAENWNSEAMKFESTATVELLWRTVLSNVAHHYEKQSARCAATRRKTLDFIGKTKIDDKLLAGFLLQTFIKVRSNEYKSMLSKDREALFEQFDSLRRTFGKRV